MFRKFALAAIVAAAFGASAKANPVFIGNGQIQDGSGGFVAAPGGPPNGVNQLIGNTTLGIQFVNQTSTNAFTPGVTQTVNTVGSNLLATYGFRNGGGVAAQYAGQDVVAVFAAQGTVTAGAGGLFNLTNLGAALYAVPTGTYNQNDPSTWTSATLIASYGSPFNAGVTDAGAAAVNGGGPGFANLGAGQVNQISANIAVGSSNQGFFLQLENGNQDFWNIIGNAGLLPNNNPNAIVTRVDESLQVADSINTAFLDATGLAALNNIFNNLLPGASAFGFASAIGAIGDATGAGSSYNPSNGNPAPNTGDLVFTLGTTTLLGNIFPQNEPPVPEPATLAVFAAMGVGGLVYRRRKTA